MPDVLTVLLPAHTAEKLDQLCDYYRMPRDLVLLPNLVDMIDAMHGALDAEKD